MMTRPTQRDAPVAVRLPPCGVFVLESHHGSGFRMEPSRHDFWEVFFVLSGEGEIELDERRERCAGEDVLVVPPGVVHRITDRPEKPLALYGLCVAPRWMELGLSGRLGSGRLTLAAEVVPALRMELRRLLFEQTMGQPGTEYLLVGRTLTLLGRLVRAELAESRRPPPGAKLAEVMKAYALALDQRFFEPTDIDREAAALRMSRRRFTQLFREQTGRSWLEHVTLLRVDYAKRLLASTRRSVTAIAFECGFEELSSFYRAFKKHCGMAPLEWRVGTAKSPVNIAGVAGRAPKAQSPHATGQIRSRGARTT
jgi:AraC family L-rhamnose operon regulatory protein RhaS